MSYVLRVVGNAAGMPCPEAGQFVRSCDFNAHEGRGELRTTTDPYRAIGFKTAADALNYWRTQSRRQPLRPDGQPNRPLTAFDMEVMRLAPASHRKEGAHVH